MADTCESAKWEKSVFLVALIQQHLLCQTLCGHFYFLIWHLFSSFGQFGAFWLQVSGGTPCSAQSRAVLTEQARVYTIISPGTGARQGLRRSFKKHVCITDDLLEEMPLLSHFFNQIWPALMSVQLGWLLCIQWQEKPDTPQLNMVFGELISFFSWEVIFLPMLPVQMEEGNFFNVFF